ncbi:unnamed protein product [Phytomonas sp. Hart1]|nr:unnamed protein product [Phytomonas sp. Hart1]|eukprot:CCW71742.1 unnamed protein product [Phytomonas sp. isolate Hart1]
MKELKSSASVFHKDDLGTRHVVSCVRSGLGGALTLVGTNRGSVLGYYHPENGDGSGYGTLIYMQRMHHGSVYSFALNSSNLVASTGHDGACCVFTLASIFSRPHMMPHRRFTGHTLPVIAAAFFSDDRTLASLSIDGLVLLHDVLHKSKNDSALVGSLRVGFPSRCLALSPDETCCFVAGRRLARVDLFHGLRPSQASEFETTDTQRSFDSQRPWLSFYSWKNSEDMVVNTTATDEYFQNLDVCREDGSVLGTIAHRSIADERSAEGGEKPVGHVHWTIAPGRCTASIGVYSPTTEIPGSMPHKEAGFHVGTHLDLHHNLNENLPLLWEGWSAKDLHSSQCNIASQPWKESPRFSGVRWDDLCQIVSGARSSIPPPFPVFEFDRESRLIVERVKNKQLKQECNELFAELKALAKRQKDSEPERLKKKRRLGS